MSHTIKSYASYVKNYDILSCSSGGVATALAIKWISSGGYVAGVVYTPDFKDAEYILTNDIKDIARLKGSKYIEPKLNNIFMKIKNALDDGKRVLFFGLPCKVGGIRRLVGENDNLLTCELICYGPTYSKVQQDFVNFLEKKFHSRIIDFSVRKKKEKWLPFFAYAKFDNGKEHYEEFYKSNYGTAFSYLPLEKCFNCVFKGNNRMGDLQIGDFWGFDKKSSYYNNLGTSCILVHTERGLNYLKSVDNLALFEVPVEKILDGNKSIYTSRTKPINYDKMLSLLKKYDLIYATKKGFTAKQKFSRFIMKIKIFIKKILRPFVWWKH